MSMVSTLLAFFCAISTTSTGGTIYQTSVYGQAYDYIEISNTIYGQPGAILKNTTTCLIGVEEMRMGTVRYDRFHNPVIAVSFPSYPSDTILDAKLKIKKMSGDIEVVSASYYVNDGEFNSEDFNSKEYIGYFFLENDYFTIDITNAMKDALNQGENLMYVYLGRSYIGSYGEIYIANDMSANSPKTIITTSETTSSNNYGDYEYAMVYPGYPLVNCYSYALGILTGDTMAQIEYPSNTPYSEEVYYNTIVPNLIKDLVQRGFHPRLIETYNSPIYSFERRIAFRMGVSILEGEFDGFHFIKQCDDGSWADKKPTSATSRYFVENPDDILWEAIYDNVPTIYIAIS